MRLRTAFFSHESFHFGSVYGTFDPDHQEHSFINLTLAPTIGTRYHKHQASRRGL